MAREIEFDMRLFSGLPVTIQGGYSFGHPGQVSGPPEVCFPPEPSEFEFTVYWRGKPKDKKLYRCNKDLSPADEERVYLEADKAMEGDYYVGEDYE